MRSFTQPSFWDAYRHLPEHIQRQARQSYQFFLSNPRHPSLEFKRVSHRRPVYSVRVSIDYRALGVMDGDDIVWFWIGPHHEYDQHLKRI
ncbi:MAG: hypothetical protein QGG64_10305 [Candidatus Latescibacteria bacterium]|nr:hypothetical protein [Candidatus Latescibacterota bacterium]